MKQKRSIFQKERKELSKHSKKEQETVEGLDKLQEALAILVKEEEDNYLKELEELPVFQEKKYPSFEEVKRDLLFAINKNKVKFLNDEEMQKEIAYYRSQLSEEQRKLTDKEKLEEAYSILEKEEKEELEKEITKSLKRFEKRIQNPFYPFINTWSKKIVAVTAGILFIISISYFPKQEKILSNNGFLSRQEEEYTKLQLPRSLKNKVNVSIETYYRPTYLPKGYELEEEVREFNRYNIVYKKRNSDSFITYKQNNLGYIPDITNVEDYNIEIINGKPIYYSINKNSITLIYYKGTYRYSIISRNSNHTKNELIKILDSLSKVD